MDFIKNGTLKILNNSFKLNIDFYQNDSSIDYFNEIFNIKGKSDKYKNNLVNESERLKETLSAIDSILFAIKNEEWKSPPSLCILINITANTYGFD